MRRVTRALAALSLAAASTVVALTAAAGPAQADTVICEQYGTTTIQGRYVVQNNRWGSNAEQCITVTDTGFTITRQAGSAATDGAPLSYPSVFYGCHYNNCSPGTSLPMQVSQISSATSSINYTFASGTFNASYDIWLDPTPKRNGVNQMEIMIWFNRQGSIQPIGSRTDTATIGGRTWEVWTGSNGMNNVISYVSPSPISSWSFSVLDFINDVRNRGLITNSWYLTSIQAGFEPWNGGVGLAVNSFSASVNGGGNNGGGSGGGWQRRRHELPGHLHPEQLARRVHRGDHHHQHRIEHDQRLGADLPPPGRADHQPDLERQHHAERVTGHRAERHPQRHARPGSQHLLRLPGQLLRRLLVADVLLAQRHDLRLTAG